MHNRRDVLKMGLGASLLLGAAALGGRALAQEGTGASLVFDPETFSELQKTITTAAGDKAVTYRFYKAIPYVAIPVDLAYQSLNVSVPIAVDGVAVDASNAPILFSNSVGGYMPSSVAEATGIGGGGMMGMPPGAPPGAAGAPAANGGEVASGGNAMMAMGKMVSNAEQALAAGFVVVEPGARGRTLTDADGTYYGVAPAAIVDLKAAVRYVRFNKGRIPGNTDHIVSSGTSAGGALSALLGASCDSPFCDKYLSKLGAADASDAIYASGDWCPITDLEHADMAYEWNWGSNPLADGALVDQSVSQELRTAYTDYLASLSLTGPMGFGPLSTENYGEYLLQTFLQPAATDYLAALSDADRAAYLAANPFLTWTDGKAQFTWTDFLQHVGARKKNAPAFDAFDLSTGENNEFGQGTIQSRHFTQYSLHKHLGASATLDADLPAILNMMNPMYFIGRNNPLRAKHWWIRVGTKDSDTALTVVGNLAASVANRGDDVDAKMYWDAGHGANEDAADFIDWIGKITGYGQ